jgi:NYN domain
VDRCALFVDAGYVLGDGAMAVHGTRNRESVSWDYAGVLEVLRNVARDHTGLPLLRCYWYEATVEGRRSSEHEILADLPGVKLRLGKMKPGRREGVESEIHRDLTTLARNRAISDALVLSADDDLAQVIAEVQDLGLRVILVHIAAPGWTAAAALRQECDETVEIREVHLRPSVELVVGAEPAGEEDRQTVPAYASRAPANGHGTPGVIGQPVPAGSHAAPPALYTGPVIAEYQRAAQPVQAGPAAQPGPGGKPGPAPQPAALAGPPAPSAQPALPGQHAAPPGHHAAPGHRAAGPPQHAAPVQPIMPPGQPAPSHVAAHISGPLTAPLPPVAAPPQHVQSLPRGGGQHAGPPSPHRESGPLAGQHAQHGLPPSQFAPGQPLAGPVMPGQPVPGQPVPGQPGPASVAPGYQAPAGLPGAPAAQARPAMPGYQTTPPPPPPPPAAAPVPPLAVPPPAAPPRYPSQAADVALGQAPALPRPPTSGAPPGPASAHGAVPAGPVLPPGQQPRGVPTGYPAALPAGPPGGAGDQRARQTPVVPGQPGGAMPGPYVPPQGPYSGLQPAAQHALVPQPVAVSLADAVQAAHAEGFSFGQGVARDAPALWLEAVLARKPRMPSDLEARLLQDSSLPIDSLLHDEVRHALRRGFWDALERVRH